MKIDNFFAELSGVMSASLESALRGADEEMSLREMSDQGSFFRAEAAR
jgi:hypothetical protein